MRSSFKQTVLIEKFRKEWNEFADDKFKQKMLETHAVVIESSKKLKLIIKKLWNKESVPPEQVKDAMKEVI